MSAKASQPKRHHYCPRFYLTNFTGSGDRKGKLWVTDLDTGKVRSSTPKNEAHQRDFYMVEVEQGEDPYCVEKMFGDIETPAAAAIEYIQERRELPEDNDAYNFLIAFIGLQGARVPHLRNKISDAMDDIGQTILRLSLGTRDRFESTVARLVAEGADLEGLTYEDMQEFVANGQMRIETPQSYVVTQLLKSASTITDLLLPRTWIVVEAPNEVDFVSSDNPVGLSWIKQAAGFFPPGFGLRNTQVTFPISSRLALLGTFEKGLAGGAISREQAAAVNNGAIANATRYIYSCQADFSWFATGNVVKGRQEFLELRDG